jgi:hypothetical protein
MFPRVPLALSFLLITFAGVAAQSPRKLNSAERQLPGDSDPAAQAIIALRKLDHEVIVYRSLADWEEAGKLASVPLRQFERDFAIASAEVGPLLAKIPSSKLRGELSNALDSYRDGLFWWRQIDQPRVVHVSALQTTDQPQTISDTAFRSTIPYNVAIHWRQARKYLNQAEVARASRP